MKKHPIILFFGESDSADFPLILIIGREPNSDMDIENKIGSYKFELSPRCGFWNTSHGMLARIEGIETRKFKERCSQKNRSPIIYADSLPHCLKNQVKDKSYHRKQLTSEEIKPHIVNMFSHHCLINRVRLVITSGLQHEDFHLAKNTIKVKCNELNIPLIHLSFFNGVNDKKIQNELDQPSREIIQSVLSKVFDSKFVKIKIKKDGDTPFFPN
jgi:hypothetical protein